MAQPQDFHAQRAESGEGQRQGRPHATAPDGSGDLAGATVGRFCLFSCFDVFGSLGVSGCTSGAAGLRAASHSAPAAAQTFSDTATI